MHGLEHRGPDDQGWLSFHRGQVNEGRDIAHDLIASVLLVHRRLSILDLSQAGRQPMCTPDRRHAIVFNGEIYNYVELKKELEGLGHRFRSRSDTEVLMAAFAEWGIASLPRLTGMFALAILDTHTRKIFLARDGFGIKPLYYTLWQDGFAFASEIPPLLHLPGIERSANARRVYEYLRSGSVDHGEETLFAAVKQLPPAHYMEIPLDDPGAAQPRRYWDIDLDQETDLSFEDAAHELRTLFLDNVRLHLRSDVPVGAALSGGIDSSSIVSAMRVLDPKLEIHAFSYIANDPSLSEESWVDVVGKAQRLVVHKVKVEPHELMGNLNDLITAQGEPFGSTSMYAQWHVFRAAREAGIKVMLDGQGADELLGGYAYYRIAQISALLRQGRWGQAARLCRYASSLPNQGPWWVAPRVMSFLVPGRWKATLRQLVKKDVAPRWFNAAWLGEHGVQRGSPNTFNDKQLNQVLYRTLTETSLPHLLRSEDRNSMAFSIESRVPFLTPALAKFVLALPAHYLIASDGTSKAVFREAMRGIVPDAILDRRDKLGFPTPERHWLFTVRSWVDQVLTSPAARSIRALDLQEVQREWSEIVGGARAFDSRVWRWLNLILWVQKFSVSVH